MPLTIGQYYYFAMDGNHGDVCNYTINVTEGSTLVPPLPEAEPVAGDATPCFGETETYSIPEITGANFYEWTVDGLPAGDGASVDITWDAFGIHQLCVTAFNVCDTVAPSCTPVFVFPPIGTQLFPEICEGDCFEVADTLVCDAGNYTFILSAANGCDSVIQVQVSVLPEVSSSYSALICDSDSLLVGDTWYFPPGQFAEMQTSYNGCDSIINLTLNAIICEITGETEVQHILCHGDLSGQITFSVVDGTPPFTYTWQQLDGSPSGSGSLSDINTPETISNLPPGGYLIGVQDPFGNDVILTANVFEPPALSLEFETTDFNGYEISCAGGQNGAATAIPTGGTPGYAFEWSNGSVQSGINSQPAGVYGLTITDAVGCTLMAEIALTEPPALDLEALFVDPGCDGFDSGSASVLSASGGVLPYEFAISGGNGFGTNTSFPGLFGGNLHPDRAGCQRLRGRYIGHPGRAAHPHPRRGPRPELAPRRSRKIAGIRQSSPSNDRLDPSNGIILWQLSRPHSRTLRDDHLRVGGHLRRRVPRHRQPDGDRPAGARPLRAQYLFTQLRRHQRRPNGIRRQSRAPDQELSGLQPLGRAGVQSRSTSLQTIPAWAGMAPSRAKRWTRGCTPGWPRWSFWTGWRCW